ncbi:hypothetical protein EJ04DRAFT_581647, partial [Polyplosphaeria fusca]
MLPSVTLMLNSPSRSPPEAPESEKGSGLGFGNDTDEPPVAPRAHKKSKRGCRTCKQRKIKCDENHPLCDNCRVYYQNKVAECDYGTPPTSTPQSSTGSSRHANQRKKRKGKDLKLETSQAKLEPLQDSLPTTTEVINLPFLIPGTLPQSPIFTPISAEMMDPFHTHPSTPEPEADELLRHYFQSTVYQIFPFYPTPSINPQAEFYSPLIYTDPLLYHVTLQLSAFHLEKLRGSRTKPQSKRLMTECLRLLRERVESATGCGTSDETIAGVAGLASIEHERGNVRMLRLHLHGLTQILLHRGGLHALRTTSPMIANLVFCIFAAANEEPFPASDLLTPFPTPDWYLSSLSSVSEPQGISFEDHGVAPAYATVLRNVRLLAKDFQQASDCDSSEMYLSVLSFLCANVQRIMSLPPVSRVRSRAYCVAECVRAALIVHVFHLWCGRFTPDPELLVNNARQNLKS